MNLELERLRKYMWRGQKGKIRPKLVTVTGDGKRLDGDLKIKSGKGCRLSINTTDMKKWVYC